jgi:hypothetical protein
LGCSIHLAPSRRVNAIHRSILDEYGHFLGERVRLSSGAASSHRSPAAFQKPFTWL